jgi:hypothetical protein
LKGPEFALLRALADATHCSTGFLSVEATFSGYQPRDFLTGAGNGDFLAALDQVE